MRRQLYLYPFLILLFLTVPFGNATEEYAEKTGKSCGYCHLGSSGGGELTKAGENYLQDLIEETETDITKKNRKAVSFYIRFLAGFLHVIMGFFWFGTILYVHIILKPAYAVHGLPRGEVRLGLFSMLVMGITGTILTLYRIPSLSSLFESRFGILLVIKMALFLIMVCAALFVVFFLGPRLKHTARIDRTPTTGDLSADELAEFDGAEDRQAIVGYMGKLYDMTQSALWKDGAHFGRHKAGEDLTDMLNQAPHGEDKIFRMPLVGKLTPSQEKKPDTPKKIFYFMAYLNLIIVLLIIAILALWKWW